MSGRFRPDIEGLRAVAVVLVVLFHAGVPWVQGGYVGVDVFFVVSGFLITDLLWRELQDTGRISLRDFYARRIRRLLPLSALVLVSTVAVGTVVLPPLQALDVVADAKAAAAYVANLRFATLEADYFTADGPPSPLLHYWSLAVEEQFYVVWPVLLLVARRWALPVIAAVGVASFAACVVVTTSFQPTAYFLLPTRAWELAFGGALAIVAPRPSRRAAAPLACAGLVAIGWSAVMFSERTAFPGAAALVPVLGTVAVLCGAGHGPARLLGVRPLRDVGRLSYAWYLWHWPVMVLAAAAVGRTLSPVENLALAATSFWLAAATHHVVENPIRHNLRLPAFRIGVALTSIAFLVPTVAASRVPSLAGPGQAAAAPVFTVSEAAVSTTTTPTTTTTTAAPAAVAGRPRTTAAPRRVASTTTTTTRPRALSPLEQALATREVPSNLTPSLSKAADDKPRIYPDRCHRMMDETTTAGCVYGVPDAPTTVVLFGDSHAAHWFPALERLAITRKWRLVSMTKSGCPPVDGEIQNSHLKRRYTECEEWLRGVLERIASEKAELVVMSTMRPYGRADAAPTGDEWRAALARMVAKVRQTGARPLMLGPTPSGLGDVPACLSEHMRDIQACVKPTAELVDAPAAAKEAATVRDAGGTFVELVGWLCLDRCPTIIGNLLIYRDDSHVTTTFSSSMAESLAPHLTT